MHGVTYKHGQRIFTSLLFIYTVAVVFASAFDHRDTAFTFFLLVALGVFLLKRKNIQAGIFILATLVVGSLIQLLSHDPFFLTLPRNLDRKILITGPFLDGLTRDTIKNVSTNQNGWRSWKNPTSPDYTIAFLGASTTEEIYLDDSETWTARLTESIRAKHSKSIRFFNAGLSGTRIPHQLSSAKKIDADLYVFFIGVNDWNFDITQRYGREGSHYVNSELVRLLVGKLSFKNHPVNIFSLGFRSFKKPEVSSTPIPVDGLTDDFGEKLNSLSKRHKLTPKVEDFPSSEFKNGLKSLNNFCKDRNCLLLTQPTIYPLVLSNEALASKLWMTPPGQNFTLGIDSLIAISKSYNDEIVKFANSQSIPVCDVRRSLNQNPDYFLDDVHLTEAGSAKLAEEVGTCLQTLSVTGWLSPKGT